MLSGFLSQSIIGRAIKENKVTVEIINLRQWGLGKHQQVDDTPYGGGAGMVLRVDVIAKAIRDTKLKVKSKKLKVILMTPQGMKFDQAKAKQLSTEMVTGPCDLILVCGHYEGFDERIREYVDEEISIGDYVLTGGELAAAVITDAVVRLLPGVLGKAASHEEESFSISCPNSDLSPLTLLEYPHYTKPDEFDGKKVPAVLTSGHHANIEKWRLDQSKKRTKQRRPDLG
jgi:tRNA (guanine37-N1)-methyltransferase